MRSGDPASTHNRRDVLNAMGIDPLVHKAMLSHIRAREESGAFFNDKGEVRDLNPTCADWVWRVHCNNPKDWTIGHERR